MHYLGCCWKKPLFAAKIKKERLEVSFRILCYSLGKHLTNISLVLWCVHDVVIAARHPLQSFTTKTSKNIPPFVSTYNSSATKFKHIPAITVFVVFKIKCTKSCEHLILMLLLSLIQQQNIAKRFSSHFLTNLKSLKKSNSVVHSGSS